MRLTALMYPVAVLVATACTSETPYVVRPQNYYARSYSWADGASPIAMARIRESTKAGEPAIVHASERDLDIYLKRGFEAVGFSGFNSASVQPETDALEQGKRIGADLVVILPAEYSHTSVNYVPVRTGLDPIWWTPSM